MQSEGDSQYPVQLAVSELERVRGMFRDAVQAYAEKVDSELSDIQNLVAALPGKKKFSSARLRELRDALTLLRNTQVKPGKGRRKDIKKIDGLVGDLQLLFEHW